MGIRNDSVKKGKMEFVPRHLVVSEILFDLRAERMDKKYGLPVRVKKSKE